MDFNEKLQTLRQQKGLTQEELADTLYVSRTAISKWESGRGYPSIDSLKTIASFFDITVDELLSGNELLNLAEDNTMQTETRLRDLVFGLLDLSSILFLFLPLFGQRSADVVQNVSLLSLTTISFYLKIAYLCMITAITLSGVLILALQSFKRTAWQQKLSLFLNSLGIFTFIISLQPYAAAFLFAFLIIKILLLIKWR